MNVMLEIRNTWINIWLRIGFVFNILLFLRNLSTSGDILHFLQYKTCTTQIKCQNEQQLLTILSEIDFFLPFLLLHVMKWKW